MFPIFLKGQNENLRTEIEKIIRFDTDIPYPDHPGFIVGIIDNDSTYILNFGTHETDSSEIFEIGGLSKVFTSNLILKLSYDSIIDLKARVNTFFPVEYQNPNLEEYTIEDLLMHQIPFPRRPADLSKKEIDLNDPYAFYTKEDVLNYYSNFKPKRKLKWAGPLLHYSHINYALLEIIAESVIEKPFEEALQEYVFSKFNMVNSSSNAIPASITEGYDRSLRQTNPWNFQSFRGAEGISSNLEDLLHFLKLNLFENQKIQSIKSSLIPQKQSRLSNKLLHTYTWYVLKSRRTGSIYTHSGGTESHRAYMHFKPDTKTGVVILSKSSIGTEELGMLILRMINNNWKRNA